MERRKIFWNNHVYFQLDMQVNMVNNNFNNFSFNNSLKGEIWRANKNSLLFTTSKPSMLESQTCLTITSKVIKKNSRHLKKICYSFKFEFDKITI